MKTLTDAVTLICGRNKDGRDAIWFVLGEHHPHPLSEDLNRVVGLIRRRDQNFAVVERFFILTFTVTPEGATQLVIPNNLLIRG
ncbi:MAG: hypothetical protein UY50_C0033G0010 [Parcubacteria group bacterium GW2011_GWA2_49_9]|nr:MAG: hypothetical protein UY50_C0033G0010 [Parcubacteria group bacterium GW2011_GWA2_49_9]